MNNNLNFRFLLFVALLIFGSRPSSAQLWQVNTNGDLETDNLGASGGTPYINTLIYNSLGINFTPGSSLLLPATPGGTPSTLYPLAVTGPTVLWDPSDGVRNVLGLSEFGGIQVLTGSDPTNSAGLLLYSTSSTFYPGSASLLSNGVPGSQVALSNVNFDPVALTYNPLFVMTTNGNARIGNVAPLPASLYPTATDRLTVDGSIYINTDDNTDVDRNIYAKSTVAGLNVTSGQNTDGSDGACFNAYAWNVTPSTTDPYPGAFIIKSNHYHNNLLGFGYISHEGTTPGNAYDHNIFLASNMGGGVFGRDMTLSDIVNNDVFTIKKSLGFYFPDDAEQREIHGETNSGDLSISSYTDNTTGSNIDLFGATNTSHPGQIIYTSDVHPYLVSGPHLQSMAFTNYDGTANTNNFVMSYDGYGIFGHGTDLTNIVNDDIFTVQARLGFYQAIDNSVRSIHGNTHAGEFTISSFKGFKTGSSISLYGETNATNPGQIKFTSGGTTGLSAFFNNWDGTNVHNNLTISNTGEVTVGHDLDPSMIVAGDVLTVKDQIGLYSSGGNVALMGNVTDHVLNICASNTTTAGPGMEVYGKDFPASGGEYRAGSMHYYSYGDPSATGAYGHLFGNYDPTGPGWRYKMGITKAGKVIIGQDLIDGGMTHCPGNYSLYVQDGILTEHVRVALSSDLTNWADFVFAKDYKLMPLNKVAAFIKENKHLPDVPSAEDVKNEGIDLGSMDSKLLQKIEELTLYVIQQDKRIDQLQKKLEEKINKK